ncbi:dipeptide epimerase [Francisellaceae bacterium]|nr:dipeptide epimerase [Francisellaceae bacterium]
MQVLSIDVSRMVAPLNRTFITAIRQTDVVEDIFIQVSTDIGVGYGSAPATTAITGDTLDGLEKELKIIGVKLVGQNISSIEEISNILQSVKSTGAKMAVDMAFYDLFSKQSSQPLWKYLGANQNKISTDVSLSCGSINQVEDAIQQALGKGFNNLKIKLGNNVNDDIALCKYISQKLPRNITLRLDANQGWSVDETLSFIDKVHPLNLNIELIEQPIAANDIKGMAAITKYSPYPILADESIFSVDDARIVLDAEACHIVNIKLAKSGGIYNAFKILEIANQHNIECMIGCMMESPLGIAAASHFAIAAGIKKADLDPLDWVDTKHFSQWLGFSVPNIILSEKSGLGYTPNK